jgi:hypothetical protein
MGWRPVGPHFMKLTMTHKVFLSGVIALLLIYFPMFVVLAHDDAARLEISVERLNPGGVLELRGVGFEPEVSVQLTLVGNGVARPMGEINSDPQGEFNQIVTLPPDLSEGDYHFRAVGSDHQVDSPLLTVQGVAVDPPAPDSALTESDSLLASMPSPPPAAQTTSIRTIASPPRQPTRRNLVILGFAALVVLGSLFLFVRRRPPQS